MLTKIRIFEKFWPEIKISENFDRYQDFNFFLPKSRFFRKLYPEFNFSDKKDLTKSTFLKILTKIEFLEYIDQSKDFRKLRPTSKFF